MDAARSCVHSGLQLPRNDWSAGVQLNWRLFDGGITSGAVAANRAAADQVCSSRRLSAMPSVKPWKLRSRHGAALPDHCRIRPIRQRGKRSRFEGSLRIRSCRYKSCRHHRSLTGAMEQRAEAMTLANLSYANLLQALTSSMLPLSLPLTLPLRIDAFTRTEH